MTQKSTDYWFKPRRYGYGASPTAWQGWAALIAYPLVCAAGAVALFAWLSPVPGIVLFAVFMAAVTFGFIALVRNKTDGEWRWQWNNRK
jgi:hypothetical protein